MPVSEGPGIDDHDDCGPETPFPGLVDSLNTPDVENFAGAGPVESLPELPHLLGQPRWLSGLRRSRIHSLMIARRSLCPEKLGSNPDQGSKGITFSGWHGLDMSVTVTKRR